MINLPAIFIANGVGVLLMVILVLSRSKNMRSGRIDQKLFYVMVTLTITQCILETLTFCIDGIGGQGIHILLLLTNCVLYINNIAFAFIWVLYADYKLFEDSRRHKRIYKYIGIPAGLIILGCIVNLFSPVFYEISASNVYSRTGLYIIPYLFTYLYLLYGVLLIYKYKNKVKKYLFLPAMIFMIPILIGSIIQFMFYGYSLVWLGVSVAVMSLFINVQNEVSYVDELSGLYTRQYMNNYLDVESKKSNDRNLAGIMIDLDEFKSINDEFGHNVGDNAISDIGYLLRTSIDSTMFAARYAGDEFVIFTRVDSEKEILTLVKTIRANVLKHNAESNRPYKLDFSVGYTTLSQDKETVDDFLKRMDSYMYIEKREKKK